MAAKSLREMSDKQLESEWTKAAKELDKAKKVVQEFSQEHQRRIGEAQAARILESLSDQDKSTLMQQLKAEGIKSEAKVGKNNG